MNKFSLSKHFDPMMPPGMRSSQILSNFYASIVVMFGVWMIAIGNYANEITTVYSNIRRGYYEEFPVSEYPFLNHSILSINELLYVMILLFALFSLSQIIFVVGNYIYFHKDSKSIYLMQRLPSKWEIHNMCWKVPCINVLLIFAAFAVLYGLFCLIYFWLAPEVFIPAQSIAFFWRYIP